MAGIKLPTNLEDVKAQQEFKVAPPGDYTMEVKKVEQKISQAKNPYLVFEMNIIDDEDNTDVKVFENVSLVDKALFRLKQISLATGVEISDEFETDDFVGATLEVTLDTEQQLDANKKPKETDEGEPILRNIVKRIHFEE